MQRNLHGHNLRSAPHSERTIRANTRAEASTRAHSTMQPREGPESRLQQQVRGPETLGPRTHTEDGPARDVSPSAAHLQTISAQQQQMQQMQQMMMAMQRQMTSLQNTIVNMVTPPAPAPLITAPTSTATLGNAWLRGWTVVWLLLHRHLYR